MAKTAGRTVRKRAYKDAQERDSKVWQIVELFYRSLVEFREIFDHYEWRVLQHSYQKGQHRRDLRLEPEDLAALMDFRALERLRDEHIFILKETCHDIFRGRHRTDLLDIYVSDAFHEISILKEEHYNVKTYAPQYARDSREVELSYILDEVHKLYPSKLNHIKYLFGKAKERLEELLPRFTKNRILVRSLYLNRDDFVKAAYEDGVRDFYRLMYREAGPIEGFYDVGRSFHESGFTRRSLEALGFAEAELASFTGKRSSRIKRIERLIHALLEQLRAGDSDQKDATEPADAATAPIKSASAAPPPAPRPAPAKPAPAPSPAPAPAPALHPASTPSGGAPSDRDDRADPGRIQARREESPRDAAHRDVEAGRL